MIKHALFFNSTRGDRVYNAESFRTWLRKFFTNGINSDGFTPSASEEALTSELTEGFVHINGATKYINATELTHNPAAGSGTQANNPRYDMVVIEYNENESVRDIYVKVVEGQYTGDPSTSIPAPVREGGIYQIPVAVFKIGSTGGTFDPNAISLYIDYHTAEGSDYGPDSLFIKSTIINKTDAQIAAEFTAYYALFSEETEADFEDWFDAIVETLSTANAGVIKNNIDRINGLITTQVDAKQSIIDGKITSIDAKLDALEAQPMPSGRKVAASFLSDGGPAAAKSIRPDSACIFRTYRSKKIDSGVSGTTDASDIRTRTGEVYYNAGTWSNPEYRECGAASSQYWSGKVTAEIQFGHQAVFDFNGSLSITGSAVGRRITYNSINTSSGWTTASTIYSQSASSNSNYSYSSYASVGEENTDASLDLYYT